MTDAALCHPGGAERNPGSSLPALQCLDAAPHGPAQPPKQNNRGRKPDGRDDENDLMGDIAKKVEQDMTYPGEVKVTLVREVRAVEYAR